MSTAFLRSADKSRLSVKVQTIATIAAIVGAVAVPQLFHALGAASGLGTSLGETFLPMHLPIIIVGLLAGPYAGAIAGALGPLVSFAVSGMPGADMLPFMMLELCAYGLFAGLLRNVKMPAVIKVIAVQIGGRAVRAAAILLAVYAFGNESVRAASILMSIGTGLFGLALQWTLIPLLVYRVENPKKKGALIR
ncbi:MAG: ECF transporter S component [Oscillospiraceae bacterium]|nr:ECF transporter S component [Oscillospiraceae bacterium]